MAAATAAGAAALIPACSKLTGGSFVPGNSNYVLHVRYATNTIGGKTFHTRTYNGTVPGPIFETHPGDTLTVTVVNELPPNPAATLPPSGAHVVPKFGSMEHFMSGKAMGTQTTVGAIDPMNNPHQFNTTNLHVHGIQTIPHLYEPIGTSNPAAEMIAIEPGSSYTYHFPIPPDHPSGLYWFHPHHHGATDVQVAGGMAGLIVVRGPIDTVPEIAAAREMFLVVQTLEVNAMPDGTYAWEPVAYQSPSSGGYNNQPNYNMMTVNGTGIMWTNNNTGVNTQLNVPQFTMQPGEVVRLRILNGTNAWSLPLVFSGMECYVIAFDGVNLPAPIPMTLDFTGQVTPLNIATGTNFLSTASGNRVELLIRAPKTPGTYTLASASQTGISFTSNSFPLAQFTVSGAPVTMNIPASLPLPTREYPAIADSEIVARKTVQFHQSGTQPPGFPSILTGFWVWIDDAIFDEMSVDPKYMLKTGTAEEWTILNHTTCGHPFHIHTNSFEVIEVNGTSVPPSIWDTFLVPPAQVLNPPAPPFDGFNPPGSIKIRLRFKEWTGKTVFHCHILTHEDTGMMKNILLT